MKNLAKWLAIIALVAIGLFFTSCGDTDDSGNSGGNVTNEKAVYTSVDDEGNKYELTITPKSDRAAYEPKEGDTYTLTIFYKDGTTKTSVGTVTHEVKNGSSVTATLSVSDISYTVTLLTVTDDVRVFTEIKGTIPITDGNDDDPPTIEIELTLTPQVDNESKAVIGVILNKTALALDVGSSETLVATVLPTNAANNKVTWSSSDTAVAQVSNSGLVTAVAKGNATITVTTEDGNKEAICNVTVKEVVISDIAVTGVTLNKASISLLVGGSETLTATVAPANATNKTVSWSSSDNAIATVTANGAVNAVAAGSANIIVTTADGGFTATCAMSVTSGSTNVPVTGVTLNKMTTSLLIGSTETLYETVLPSNATNKIVTWSSSNTNIVTVANGLITGIASGTANITVTTADGNKTANCGVLISASVVLPTGIRLNKTILELNVGDTETLTATVLPTNATDQNVTWEITNPPDKVVATVSDSGVVRAVSVGDAQIFVKTSNGIKTPCAVKVRDVPVTGVTLNKTALALKVGESETLTATVLPANATNKTVKWESSAQSVATVENGLVSAVSAGSAIITVTTQDGNKTANCAVTVTASYVPVTGVSLNKTTFDIGIDETEYLTPIIIPTNATNKNVTWSSSNTAIAAVSTSGLITGVAMGSTTITVKTEDGGFNATCNVDVLLTPAGLAAYLATLPANTESSPHLIKLRVRSTEEFAIIRDALSGAPNKYVNLYLSSSTLTSIPDWAFNTGNLAQDGFITLCGITIPDGVTSIGESAFYQCESLASVIIPNSVTSIGQFAFSNCYSLANVTIPNSITSIGLSAFASCTSLASVIIPNNVTSIGHGAFASCTSLASVTIGYGVISIGVHAFIQCPSLSTIIISSSNNAYSAENGILFNKNKTTLMAYPSVKGDYSIPNSVTSIEQGAFYECTSLASITIPNSVTSIGHMAFVLCTSLASVNIPNGVTIINPQTFSSCYNLASVTIGNGVTSIGSSAFSHCQKLVSVTIPENVTSIDRGAFYQCNSLASVTFQGTIPSSGFSNFTSYPVFEGDLRAKFYATDVDNGTPGTYTTTAPVGTISVWTKQ